MLGMYVHTHWSYNHPYAARTWTPDDWRNYLTALSKLGYDTVMVWPQLDTMPMPRTASDDAFLDRLRQNIDMAHSLGFKVIITLTPNVIPGPKSSEYTFEGRDYWKCEAKANPGDSESMKHLLAHRRYQFEPLANADAIAIIDSDPGGWPDSPSSDFVKLFVEQARIAGSFNPKIVAWYWAWAGWPIGYKLQTFLDTFSLLRDRADFPWQIFSFHDMHLEATDRLGLGEKRAMMGYEIIEFEPAFPLINCRRDVFRQQMQRYDRAIYPQGIFFNAQTHCLQVPGTYLAAHYARGGTIANEKFMYFGERLIAGDACAMLAEAFLHLQEIPEIPHMRYQARRLRLEAEKNHAGGDLAGLMFMSPRAYLLDVADNLDIRADFLELQIAVNAGRNEKKVVGELVKHLRPYQERVGYDHNWHMQPLRQNLLFPLKQIGDEGLERAINPENVGSRGYLPNLIDAMEKFAAG